MHPRLPACIVALAAITAPIYSQTARDEAWRRDIETLTSELARRHPNLYANVSRSEFDRTAAEIAASVSSRNDGELTVDLMRLTAMAGDAHTFLSPYSGTSPLGTVPLRLRWLSDGLFVTGSTAPSARALGKRVIAIGDVPIVEAFQPVRSVSLAREPRVGSRAERGLSDHAGDPGGLGFIADGGQRLLCCR